MSKLWSVGLALCVGLVMAVAPAEAVLYDFVTIDYPGSPHTRALGLNDAGIVVGDYITPEGQTRGYALVNNNFVDIFYPGAGTTGTTVYGINNSGQIVGSFTDATGTHAFGLLGGAFSAPINYPGVGVTSTMLLGLNDTGIAVGTFADASGAHGFSIVSGSFSPTINFNGPLIMGSVTGTSLSGVNNAGPAVAVGSFGDSAGVHGFGVGGGVFSAPYNFPGAESTFFDGNNDAGWIVGGYIDGGTPHGLLFNGSQFDTLDNPNGLATRLWDINNQNWIVGNFVDEECVHGFIARPVPEPLTATATMIGAGGLALALARRRRG